MTPSKPGRQSAPYHPQIHAIPPTIVLCTGQQPFGGQSSRQPQELKIRCSVIRTTGKLTVPPPLPFPQQFLPVDWQRFQAYKLRRLNDTQASLFIFLLHAGQKLQPFEPVLPAGVRAACKKISLLHMLYWLLSSSKHGT